MFTLIDVAFLWFTTFEEFKLLSLLNWFAYFKCKHVYAHISCLFVIIIQVIDTITASTTAITEGRVVGYTLLHCHINISS